MTIGINLISIGEIKGGGTLTFIKNIISSLKYFTIKDTRFVIYKQKQIPKELFQFPKDLNIEWVDVPNLGAGYKRLIFEQTLFYLYLKNSDIIFSHCTSLPLFANANKIFTLHDVYYKEYKNRYSKFKTLFLDILTKIYLKKCSKIITVSEYSKSSILRHYNVKKDKINIVYNFLNNSTANEPYESKSPSIDIKIIKKSFLYIGSIQPGKNIKGMVEGFIKFNSKFPNYHLIIVGKPTYNGEKIISELPINDNIHYLGYQPDSIVNYLQKNCFATVLVSFCEGFGLPPLEGFKYHKPSLTSNVTSLPEITGVAGICVNPYDINEIAKGFIDLTTSYDQYKSHTQEQVNKYQMITEMSKFLTILEIPYKLKLIQD